MALLCLTFVMNTERGEAADATQKTPLIAYNGLLVGDDARARLVVDFDREPSFSYRYVANPDRVIISLPPTAFGFPDGALNPRGLISDIRYGSTPEGGARIVLTGARAMKLTLGEVRKSETDGFRLVIDLAMITDDQFSTLLADQLQKQADEGAAALSSETVSDPAVIPRQNDDFLVAVDAGHGGIDNGAMGEDTHTPEKVITLAFAKAFAARLKQESGYDAFLTRDKDEYLTLSQRVEIARQHDADLFISFHADSLTQQPEISGATVYTISDRASDRLAAAMARRENLSDSIAGIPSTNEPEAVTDILLDLTRRETQNFSIDFADKIVDSFNGQIGLINNPHRYAGFQVLRAPDIPSVLLEIGFLSNPDDEKRMQDPAWRTLLVDRLVKAVKQYHETTMSGG
ncbi:N-acetylmuramoyl-L-alanine amidase [Martelella alba]|uniref:N-acetylmuramoyl-L-alanine amidase n=2 Tax=Martelella alba TaxID=2590451 RepID=A0A506UJW3_9HYPH|nr:N-acetylmuramoyl-L-alanine amidase [Martelella alba]